MEEFEFRTADPEVVRVRSKGKRDKPMCRLLRCLDLFEQIEAWHPEGSLRAELVRACGMTSGVYRERCLGILIAKIERTIGEALA